MARYSQRYSVNCGLLLRGFFRRALDDYAFELEPDVSLTHHESKGFLGSTFQIRLESDSEAELDAAVGGMDDYLECAQRRHR
jgi:hypothetical protein